MSIREQSLGGELGERYEGADGADGGSGADRDDGAEGPTTGRDETISPEDLGELAALQGVVKFPVRIKCATLSWNALAQGLDEIAAGVPSAS